MKTKEQSIIFSKEEVQKYTHLLGDFNPVYESEEKARSLGFRAIPIPPAMPMIAYRLFERPWKMQPPVVHRKQQCILHRKMFIEEKYTGIITLSDMNMRKGNTFSKQTLLLYDEAGDLCFTGISHNVSGEII